jgi:hypothetical protein
MSFRQPPDRKTIARRQPCCELMKALTLGSAGSETPASAETSADPSARIDTSRRILQRNRQRIDGKTSTHPLDEVHTELDS